MKHVTAAFLCISCVLAGCSDPAVSKAVGTGGDADAPIAVAVSTAGLSVENHAGRPLLNVRMTIDSGTPGLSFIRVLPTIDAGAHIDSQPSDFRSDDGTLFDPRSVHPTTISITARDTLGKSYHFETPWGP